MFTKYAKEAKLQCPESVFTPEKVTHFYDIWAKEYDKDLFSGKYNGPEIAVEEILCRVPEIRREEVKIIDVAAGTGRVGALLKEKKFKNIDALEPSEGMMDLLKKTGVYTNTYLEFLGVLHSSISEDVYDILVTAGGMVEGHIPVKGIDDMIRITKPGGYVIIAMRMEFLDDVEEYKGRLVPYMDNMEKQGKWTKVEVKTVKNWYMEKDGIVFTYKVI